MNDLKSGATVVLDVQGVSIRSSVLRQQERELYLTPDLTHRLRMKPETLIPVFLSSEISQDEVYSILLWYEGQKVYQTGVADVYKKERSTEELRRWEALRLPMFCWSDIKVYSIFDRNEVALTMKDRIAELGESSFTVITHNRVTVNSFADCTFELGSSRVEATCRVMRMELLEKNSLVKLTFEFIALAPTYRRIIRKFLLAEQARRFRG